MTSDESFLSPFGGISNNSLIHLLQLNNNEVDEQESQLLKHSSYYDANQFAELTESINAKFDELTIYIEERSKINFKCSVINFVCKKLDYQMMLTYLFSKLPDMTAFHKENLAVKKGGYLYT